MPRKGETKFDFGTDKDFLENYKKLRSSRKMAELYGCTKNIILAKAKSLGFTNTQFSQLTKKDKDDIINAYEEKTSTQLAKEYNVSRGQITKVWFDAGLSGKDRHTYPFNFNYFKKIDSKDKAYFLGWLASDGNIYKRPDIEKSQSWVRLILQQEDEYILNTFKRYIDSESPLGHHEKTLSDGTTSIYSSLALVSNNFLQDLSKYNIIPNKTRVYEMVDLGDVNLMRHFFRGYFDGDGSINITHNEYCTPSSYRISITGFSHNLKIMQEYLLDNLNITSYLSLDKRSEDPFGSLVFSSIESKYNFLKYIYTDIDDLYLTRKKYKADCFFTAIKNNYSNKQNLYNKIIDNAVS